MKELPNWLKFLNKIAIVLTIVIVFALIYQTAENMADMSGYFILDVLLLPFVLVASFGELLKDMAFVAAFLCVIGVYLTDIICVAAYGINELAVTVRKEHSHISRLGDNDNYYM